MGSRTWIKIYCDSWLNGTIHNETPALRGMWVDLLVLAGSGKYGDSGEIKITDQTGFLDKQLADLLQISVQKWVVCKKKLIQSDRVCVENNNVIVIKNWAKYQSEYTRQRPYRQLQDTSSTTPENNNEKLHPKVTPQSATRDRDKRIEIEIKKEFDIFWQAYPKRKNKGQAEKAFSKVNPDEQLLATMLATIEQAKKSRGWQKEGGKYIPYPATWLNAKGWEDEVIEVVKTGARYTEDGHYIGEDLWPV